MVVGVVALPLSMALAIAVGVAPQYGLYTAIVAGFIAALLGGSRVQVTGPTASFVILAPIFARFGMAGLLAAGIIAGVVLFSLGVLRFGRFVNFVPYPVTTGFAAGIAVVVAGMQVRDLAGLRLEGSSTHFLERMSDTFAARGTVVWWELVIAAGTLGVLLAIPKLTRKVPSPLVALPLAAVAAWLLEGHVKGCSITTISDRFTWVLDGVPGCGIPRVAPVPSERWFTEAMFGPGGQPLDWFSYEVWRGLLPSSLAVAMLGALESLLSAVVADGILQTRHDPDAELCAQGIANIVTPFFGGIPATGAVARSVTNLRFGATSPIAAMVHSLTVLAAMLGLAPLLGYLPMSALAALLLVVAWNMSEARHVWHILRMAPGADIVVMVVCILLTVIFDMVVAVAVGFVLAAVLFMRRMADLTQAGFIQGAEPQQTGVLPAGVVVFSINGPLFFGAAERAMGALGETADSARAVVFRLKNVPAIDATGLIAMESALARLKKRGILAVLAAVPRATAATMLRGGIRREPGKVAYSATVEDGIRIAGEFASGAVPVPVESMDNVPHGGTRAAERPAADARS